MEKNSVESGAEKKKEGEACCKRLEMGGEEGDGYWTSFFLSFSYFFLETQRLQGQVKKKADELYGGGRPHEKTSLMKRASIWEWGGGEGRNISSPNDSARMSRGRFWEPPLTFFRRSYYTICCSKAQTRLFLEEAPEFKTKKWSTMMTLWKCEIRGRFCLLIEDGGGGGIPGVLSPLAPHCTGYRLWSGGGSSKCILCEWWWCLRSRDRRRHEIYSSPLRCFFLHVRRHWKLVALEWVVRYPPSPMPHVGVESRAML